MIPASKYFNANKRLIDSDYYVNVRDFKKAINQARLEAIGEVEKILTDEFTPDNEKEEQLQKLIKELK